MSRKMERPRLNEFFYGSVTVGERGQVVIPAEARKQSGFEAGDKLLVFRHPHLRGVVLAHVDDITSKDIQPGIHLTALVCFPKVNKRIDRVKPRILRQRARHDLNSVRKGFNCHLFTTTDTGRVISEALCDNDCRRTAAGGDLAIF